MHRQPKTRRRTQYRSKHQTLQREQHQSVRDGVARPSRTNRHRQRIKQIQRGHLNGKTLRTFSSTQDAVHQFPAVHVEEAKQNLPELFEPKHVRCHHPSEQRRVPVRVPFVRRLIIPNVSRGICENVVIDVRVPNA